MQENISEHQYDNLLQQFSQYQQKVQQERQRHLERLTNYKKETDRIYKELQKKYESKIKDESTIHNKKQKKGQQKYNKTKQQMVSLIHKKDQKINELIKKLSIVQSEKGRIVQDNTTILCEIVRENEENQLNTAPSKIAYTQLSKLYQYVLQENNSLKKQLCRSERQKQKQRQKIYVSERLVSEVGSMKKGKQKGKQKAKTKNTQVNTSIRSNNHKDKDKGNSRNRK